MASSGAAICGAASREAPPVKDAQVELREAIAAESEAHRLLLRGEQERARPRLNAASEHYRRSWELAPPTAYGRLVGMMKAAILAGATTEAAAYVRQELEGIGDSPTAAYALALAALARGDDKEARGQAPAMRGGSESFARAAAAIEALADRDAERYAAAIGAIVRDFEARSEHLTGVAIADTALCLERLADERGVASGVNSPLLPRP
jgi:tetratricopeptide (TPR) repeat protein